MKDLFMFLSKLHSNDYWVWDQKVADKFEEIANLF